MQKIEKKFTAHPELKKALLEMAVGKEGAIQRRDAIKYGYMPRGKHSAESVFVVDVADWLMKTWRQSYVPARKQHAVLDELLASPLAPFQAAKVLLDPTPGPDGHFAPLACMVAHMIPDVKIGTSYLCILAAAAEEAPPFPFGFAFPKGNGSLERSLREVRDAVRSFMANEDEYIETRPHWVQAIRNMRAKEDLLWTSWDGRNAPFAVEETGGIYRLRPKAVLAPSASPIVLAKQTSSSARLKPNGKVIRVDFRKNPGVR